MAARLRVFAYGPCSTCRKALAWLAAQGISAEVLDISTAPPSRDELAEGLRQLGSRSRLFNTSGQRYRALGAERVRTMDDAAALANLAAGVVVGKVGTATVTAEEILEQGRHATS